jgi:hypothetical protein
MDLMMDTRISTIFDFVSKIYDGILVNRFESGFGSVAGSRDPFGTAFRPGEVVKSCLAHASGDAVEKADLRADFMNKRRAAIGE